MVKGSFCVTIHVSVPGNIAVYCPFLGYKTILNGYYNSIWDSNGKALIHCIKDESYIKSSYFLVHYNQFWSKHQMKNC